MSSAPSDETRDRHERMRRIVRGAWIAAAIVGILVALAVGTARITASPVVCGACHAMQPEITAWETSPHNQVGCPACHEDPLPWYRFPETLATRGVMLKRDLSLHLSSDSASASREITTTIPDARCLECHHPGREITIRYGTLIDHTEHAERNGSCISCHRWTAHPDPDADPSLLLMGQCFTCHGRSSTAKAPGTCDVCHPASFDLVPISHNPPAWQSEHGASAMPDRQTCLMCHDENTCRDCHGLDMPHPKEWVVGSASVHGASSEKNRGRCEKCHSKDPDFCTRCHHEKYAAAQGTWVAQHPAIAGGQDGATLCTKCHAPTFCVDCHTTRHIPTESEQGEDG